MKQMMTRRGFLGGATVIASAGPWRMFASDGFGAGMPELRFGVVSDVHIGTKTGSGKAGGLSPPEPMSWGCPELAERSI